MRANTASIVAILIAFCCMICNAYNYHSYMPWPSCSSMEAVKSPESIAELRGLVKEAGVCSTKLKAIGAGHTSNELICTEGTPVDMRHFNKIQLNRDDTVTVGSGARLRDVLLFLHGKGKTLLNFPSLGYLTMGGITGTGAHGSSLNKTSSLSDQIVSMRLMDGKGEVIMIEKEELNIFRIHLGLLGIVIDITLETVPSFKLKYSRKVVPGTFLTSGEVLKHARQSEYLQLHWFPTQSKVVVVEGVYEPAETEGNAYTTVYGETEKEATASLQKAYDNLQENRQFNALHAVEEHTMLSLTEKVAGRMPIVTQDGVTLTNPAVGWNFNITTGFCNQCWWKHGEASLLNEDASFGCDIKQWNSIVDVITDIAKRTPLQLAMSGIIMRFHKESNAPLSMAYKKPEGIVLVEMITPARSDFRNKPRAGLAAVQAISQALVNKLGCRPHWAKNARAFRSKNLFRAVFEPKGFEDFAKAMKKYDPLGVFGNEFSSYLFGDIHAEKDRSQVVGCALQDNCFCENDWDCAEQEQTCESFPDFDGHHIYKVCQDKVKFEDPPLGFFNPYNLTDIFRAAWDK